MTELSGIVTEGQPSSIEAMPFAEKTGYSYENGYFDYAVSKFPENDDIPKSSYVTNFVKKSCEESIAALGVFCPDNNEIVLSNFPAHHKDLHMHADEEEPEFLLTPSLGLIVLSKGSYFQETKKLFEFLYRSWPEEYKNVNAKVLCKNPIDRKEEIYEGPIGDYNAQGIHRSHS